MSAGLTAVAQPAVRTGIGGWLVVPAIGIVVGPALLLRNLLDFPAAFRHAPPGSSMFGFLLVELTAVIVFSALGLVTAVAFFRRRRRAPGLYIALLLAMVVWSAVDLFAWAVMFDRSSAIAPGTLELLRSVAVAVVLIPYFRFSERVRSSFTR